MLGELPEEKRLEMESKFSEFKDEMKLLELVGRTLYQAILQEEDLSIQILNHKKLIEKYGIITDKCSDFILKNEEYQTNSLGAFNLQKFRVLVEESYNSVINTTNNLNLLTTKWDIKVHEEQLQKLYEKMESHDKNILNIMGAFLAIFSLIGVNFSFFSNFKSVYVCEWISLIVVVNLSLVIAIMVIFWCIKWLFMNNGSESKKENKLN